MREGERGRERVTQSRKETLNPNPKQIGGPAGQGPAAKKERRRERARVGGHEQESRGKDSKSRKPKTIKKAKILNLTKP